MKEIIENLNEEEKELLKEKIKEAATNLEEIARIKEDNVILAMSVQDTLGIKKAEFNKFVKEKFESFIDEKLEELSQFEEANNLLWQNA